MRKIIGILVSLVSLLGFATNVFAYAVSSITTNITSTTKYEYVEGIEIYKNYASSYNLYVLNMGTRYDSRTTLSDPTLANEGFAYIINHSNVTSNSDKNYYIAQVAVLWFQDYLSGNDYNLTSAEKTKIKNNTSDTVCYYINKLVEGAKEYKENDSSIKIIDKEITFTKSGSYYYSNVIDVKIDNLRSTPSITLKNAPTSASVINNTVTRNGEGSFQIRIPSSSVTNYTNDEFLIEITGSGYDNTVYKYTKYGTDAAIYGRVYSNNSYNQEASIVARLNGVARTNVRINILDDNGNYIRGLKYEIYSGDCTEKTCYSDNLVTTFTTSNSYITLNNVLNSGTYTLVRKTSTNYIIPEKETINVLDTDDYIQTYTIDEDDYKLDFPDEQSWFEILLLADYSDSQNIVKIYNTNDSLVDSFRANEATHTISVNPGTYYIKDTDNSLNIKFKISDNGFYVNDVESEEDMALINLREYIFINSKEDEVNKDEIIEQPKEENKEDVKVENKEENITYDENGNIQIGNLDNIESIDIENKVETTTDVKVEWLSNIIDCPITSLSATIKYVIGAIILGIGSYLVVRNVKKSKNNI